MAMATWVARRASDGGRVLELLVLWRGTPAWFARGTSRPDPAGRAFLALLDCAVEGLSARRFAEYLSLGQVPPLFSFGAGTLSTSGYRVRRLGSWRAVRWATASLDGLT